MLDSYFGIELGLYFEFVQHYGLALAWLSLSILFSLLILENDVHSRATAVMTSIWAFLFVYSWRSKQVKRAYHNGSLNTTGRGWEEARPQYFGPLDKNVVTG